MLAPYPPGRWRLVPLAELGHVVLWASQILIRHRAVRVAQKQFGIQQDSSEAPPSRSRAAARALALDIARQAQAHPERFLSLVRTYSEDALTRTSEGSLGSLLASSLRPWPHVLDALAALGQGEVSEVVETEQGFHVFLRRAPPADHRLSGSHLVIGYNDAKFLALGLARGTIPQRTREQALELATQLYERARAAPDQFAALVAQYSEHINARVEGDFGAWPLRAHTAYSRQLELLERLPIGGITPPIETILGFEVVMRTPERPRATYAATPLRLAFDPEAPADDPSSRSSVLEQARQLARLLATDPARFEELQAQHCCAFVQRWEEGQEPRPAALAVQALAVGGVAREPYEFVASFEIPKRVDPPRTDPQPAWSFELPHPERVDIYTLARHTNRDLFAQHLDAAAGQALHALNLEPEVLNDLRTAQAIDGRFDAATDAERGVLLDVTFGRVEALLGAERHERYLDLLRDYFEGQLLSRNTF